MSVINITTRRQPVTSLRQNFNNAATPQQPLKDGQFFIRNGAVYRHHADEGDALIMAPAHMPVVEESLRATTRDTREKLQRLTMLIHMRDLVLSILSKQEHYSDDDIARTGDIPWKKDQGDLAKLYTTFVGQFGPINLTQVRSSGREDETGAPQSLVAYPNLRKFRKDPDAMLLASIERYDEASKSAVMGPIFTQRVLAPNRGISIAGNPVEAYRQSLNDRSDFDLDTVMKYLPSHDPQTVLNNLSEQKLVFLNPANGQWQSSEDFQSGNVRAKLTQARERATDNPLYATSIEALEEIQPPDVPLAEIDFGLGAPWIPCDVIAAFGRNRLGMTDLQVNYVPAIHRWYVSGNASDGSYTPSRLAAALSNRMDRGETGVAGDKELDTLFKEWIYQHPEQQRRLQNAYNESTNYLATPQHDGSHLTLPGLSVAVTPHPHQRDVVWRTIKQGNTLIAHAVGAGKTGSAVILCKELRRRGLVKRPLMVVPDHLLLQTAREFMSFYPNAKLLVLEPDALDGDGPKRTVRERMERFVKRANSQEWDALVISRSNYDRIQLSPEQQLQFLIEDARKLKKIVQTYQAAGKDNVAKDVANVLQNRLDKLGDFLSGTEVPDYSMGLPACDYSIGCHHNLYGLVDFNTSDPHWQPVVQALPKSELPNYEELGTDYEISDEMHDYKNLEIKSNDWNLRFDGSARAKNFHSKLRYLSQKNPDRFLAGLTGTPVSNSLSEIYTLMRYFAPRLMEESATADFDAWRAVHAKPVTFYEMAPEGGTMREVTRLGSYRNIPELVSTFQSFADVMGDEDLKLPRPAIEGNAARTHLVAMNTRQEAIMDWLRERGKRVRSGTVPKTVDNMLSIVNDGRLAALSPRLVWPRYVAHTGNCDVREDRCKIDDIADLIATRYHAHKEQVYHELSGKPEPITGVLQLVMCDTGVPGGSLEFSIYEEMRQKLVRQGIPFDRIRFIHDAKKDRDKARLFEQCRNGTVSVLIGTTQALGTGSNIQRRLRYLYECDWPWRPSDVEQRRGRILRPGNANPVIGIDSFVTQGSHDEYGLQTLRRKSDPIARIMRGDPSIRQFDEVDPLTQEFDAILSLSRNNTPSNHPDDPPRPNSPHRQNDAHGAISGRSAARARKLAA